MNAPLPASAMDDVTQQRSLLLKTIRLEAENICSFELVDPHGEPLPAVEAGAHVDVHVAPGLVRSYSLAGDPADRRRWLLGVLLEPHGRGGSRAMHEQLRVGQILKLGTPRHAFGLAPAARRSLLLAGGLGVTPIKAMVHVLRAQGADFELHYCAKSPAQAAFLDQLAALVPANRLRLHFDGGDPARGLDIAGLLAHQDEGCHLYYCGPASFMQACEAASAHWEKGTVHCEHFKAPAAPAGSLPPGAFELRLARTGQTVEVQPGQSIVQALESIGVTVSTSCQSGLCGACKLDYLEGEVEHADYILSDEEKRTCLTSCVSRAKGGTLVLDL